jgi:hypothetical protein
MEVLMNKETTSPDVSNDVPVISPNDSFNADLDAQPKENRPVQDATDVSTEMNLEDAKESGYTDENGKAVSMAKKDVIGSPTGAYTDIGIGRSSAVVSHSDRKKEDSHH